MLSLEDRFVLPFSLRLRVIIVFPIVSRLPVHTHTHTYTENTKHKPQGSSSCQACYRKKCSMAALCPACDTDLLTAVTLLGSPAQHGFSDSHSVCKYAYVQHILVIVAEQYTIYNNTSHTIGCILFSFGKQTAHLLDEVGIWPQLANFIKKHLKAVNTQPQTQTLWGLSGIIWMMSLLPTHC